MALSLRAVTAVNEKIAQAVSKATGNMWFFWASLAFILILRISHPPKAHEFLLNFENDLQLLLLAANAVVGAKQLQVMMAILKSVKRDEERIAREIQEVKEPQD